jgi:hypothetical protein
MRTSHVHVTGVRGSVQSLPGEMNDLSKLFSVRPRMPITRSDLPVSKLYT